MKAFSSSRASIRSRQRAHEIDRGHGAGLDLGGDMLDREHGRIHDSPQPRSIRRSASRSAAVARARLSSSGFSSGKPRRSASSQAAFNQASIVIGSIRSQCAAHGDRHGQKVVIDRSVQVIPRELDRQIDAERAGRESAAAFGEDAIAVAQLTPDSPDAAADERVAAEAPARRVIRDVERGREIVGARGFERVGSRERLIRRRRPVSSADLRG